MRLLTTAPLQHLNQTFVLKLYSLEVPLLNLEKRMLRCGNNLAQGSPTYGPRAKCGHLQKIMALFKSRGAKKGHQKNLGKLEKKVRVDGPQQKKVPNFPIFLAHLPQKVGDP